MLNWPHQDTKSYFETDRRQFLGARMQKNYMIITLKIWQ